jgi:hypothetical protein
MGKWNVRLGKSLVDFTGTDLERRMIKICLADVDDDLLVVQFRVWMFDNDSRCIDAKSCWSQTQSLSPAKFVCVYNQAAMKLPKKAFGSFTSTRQETRDIQIFVEVFHTFPCQPLRIITKSLT